MYVVSGDDDGAVYKLRLSVGGKECQVSEVSFLPCGRLKKASVERYEDKLLLTSGSSEDQKVKAQTWSLDLVSSSWTQGPTLTTGRCHHTSFQLANHLYVCGGQGKGNTRLSIVEARSLTGTQPPWTPITEEPPETVNIESLHCKHLEFSSYSLAHNWHSFITLFVSVY